MEASAAGLPVIATEVGGTSEVVDEGRTGFLVPAAAVAPLAARLSRVIGDPQLRSRMGRAGREKMSREFGPDAMVAAMTEVYAGLLATGRSSTDAKGSPLVRTRRQSRDRGRAAAS
jgi:glycosyltransferase involved in cell wall biosynthesis